ncbi:MAG: DoxX family protein [Actinomycetia bacterium]|nr:DoxX family protein [Actinomycetes bacterium]MDX6334373.1 putative oxidoreductase [Streptosporangiaceae bacterium]
MAWSDVGLLLIRLVLGGTLIMHGWNHWRGGGKIAGTARWFDGLGLRPGIAHAWASVVTELGAGTLLVVGLLTPLGCAGAIGPMAVAGLVAHRRNGFFVFRDGYEYVLMISVVAVALAALGPGRISLDHAAGITFAGTAGVLTALIAGLGGAGLLLATSWRPVAAQPATPSPAPPATQPAAHSGESA